jgi:hypothetical protein
MEDGDGRQHQPVADGDERVVDVRVADVPDGGDREMRRARDGGPDGGLARVERFVSYLRFPFSSYS